MDNLELCNIIDNEIAGGIGADSSDLTTARERVYNRYMGELYGDEKTGESKVITREVYEAVEWAMPAIVRVFESGDRVVEFDPTTPQDEQAAEQETDVCNHVYQKDNNGFITTHNIIKSALMNPNSYVGVYRDESKKAETEKYEGLSVQEMMLVVNDPDIEVVGQEFKEGWNLEVKRKSSKGFIVVECIPEEEIIIHKNHNELSLENCQFVCREIEKSYSDLKLLGYDTAKLDQLKPNDNIQSEEENRKKYSNETGHTDELQKALRTYTVQECSMLLDWDNDGIAERRKVVKIDTEIFENEELDYMPYESAASVIMPHKHIQYSLAQSIIDIQDIKTYFMRQTVTNMAKVNNPRTYITDKVNLADALSNTSNGYIRVEGNDARMVAATEPTAPIIGQVLPLLDLLDQQKEGRSGITRNSMGLDADILAKSTEGAFMGAIEKADQRIEFIVRIFAETVFKSIFLKIHHLTLSYGDSKWMKLNGQWAMINPAEWKKREAMTVNVGLGVGSRNQKMTAARVIIAEQDKAIQFGLPIIDPQKLYNARRLLVESTGEKNVDKYFINPATVQQQPQQQKPDPNMIMIQTNKLIEDDKRQVEMAKLNQSGQIEQARLQFNQAKEMRALQFEQTELVYKKEIDTLKAQISQSKNEDDAASKALNAKIDELQLQLKEQQEAESLVMDKYKADLKAQTDMDIAQLKHTESGLPAIEANQTRVNESLAAMTELVNDLSQPKEIVKDDQGEILGVRNVSSGRVRAIIRDDEGLPVGLE